MLFIESIVAAALLLLFVCTARVHYTTGILDIDERPLFRVTIGRTGRWIRQSGINYIPQIHVIEFPLCPGYRIGIEVLSKR